MFVFRGEHFYLAPFNLFSLRLTLAFILLTSLLLPALAQHKCGTDPYNELIRQRQLSPQTEQRFENWLTEKKNTRKTFAASDELLIIPVVVHVIHQGETIGSHSNIPDEQILSQIKILNEDFRRTNADAENTPQEFQSVAADTHIEFRLAKRDPEGLPTNGIVRKQANLAEYGFSTDEELKAQSYWPAADYLNLWVTTLSGNLLGFAQFPTSNLPGLDVDRSINRLTDGIVIDYRYMGEGYNASDFSKGRTATHEIGHFLGLRHIWGAGGCSSDDYCDDTPNKSGSTFGCPSDPAQETSCGSVDMYQNFLDLSDDVCMNLFTTCQAQRMRTVLKNSPRRKTLLTSKALQEPVIASNDLGIRQIISPQQGDCRSEFFPQIEVRNYGTNTIDAFEVSLFINDNLIETIQRNTTLSELSTTLVSFSELTSSPGTSTYRFEVGSVNNTSDGNTENNTQQRIVNIPLEQSIPYQQTFETFPDDWTIIDTSGGLSNWQWTEAPKSTIANKGMKLPYYGSPSESFGSTQMLISPAFDLSGLPSADIRLSYAFAALPDNLSDVFTIAVSTDCGHSFPVENYIFQQFSPSLSTTVPSSEGFSPSGPGDWQELEINITEYVGNAEVVIALIGHNGNGNNLYIDDFSITSENKLDFDLSIKEVTNISPTTCSSDLFPTVNIKNQGTQTITEMVLQYSVGIKTFTETITDLNLLPGKTHIEKPVIRNLNEGDQQITFSVISPNGQTDENPENNEVSVFFSINTHTDKNPLREEFETPTLNPQWSAVRPDAAHNWELVSLESTQAIAVKGTDLINLGIENWLISPSIDFSDLERASLRFRLSYAYVPGREDELKILVSKNCGRNFDDIVYHKKGEDLAMTQQAEPWLPTTSPSDWKTEFVDLTEYTGWSELRVAFVVTNHNGNTLLLDDIEFFTDNTPNPLEIEEEQMRIYPNPAQASIHLKFDLNEKADLQLKLVDMMGKVLYLQNHPNTLNQTYTLSGLTVDNGIYLLHVQGENINFSRRVLIRK